MTATGGNFPPPAPAPLPAGTVAVPSSIDPTGRTDTTAAWNDFLNSVPDDTTIKFPIDGTYRIDMPVTVTGKTGLKLDGQKSRFVQGPEPAGLDRLALRGRYMLRLDKTDHTTIQNVQFIGSNLLATLQGKGYDSTREAQHCLDLKAARHTTVTGCQFSQPWGDAIYLGPTIGSGFPPCEDTLISHCSVWGTGRQGIAVCAATRTTIEWSTFDLNRRTVIDVEPTAAGWNVDGLTVRDITTGAWRLGGIGLNGSGTITNVRVERYVARGRLAVNAGRSATQPRVRNVEVLDCVGPAGNDRKVGMKRVDGLTVVGNRAPHIARTSDPTGCLIAETCDYEIHGNDWGSGLPQYVNQTPDYVCG